MKGKDISSLTEAAKRGDMKAQYELGEKYNKFLASDADKENARKWYKKAAEQGHAEAQYALAGLCGYDYETAAVWYEKAAEQGLAKAQYKIARYYYMGSGVTQDFEKAVEWFLKSAEQGYGYAKYDLGKCYLKGNGVPQDLDKAAEWFGGNLDNWDKLELGSLYEIRGNDGDFVKAVKLYTEACPTGRYDNREPIERLIEIYEEGRPGVPIDTGEVARLRRRIEEFEEGDDYERENPSLFR